MKAILFGSILSLMSFGCTQKHKHTHTHTHKMGLVKDCFKLLELEDNSFKECIERTTKEIEETK